MDSTNLQQIKDEYSEAIDIFPALHKYKKEHNTANLQKLCVEIQQFCNSLYASTQNDAEQAIFKNMVEKLKK